MYKIISFGYRCATATFLQKLNSKHESYPFDWLVSRLDIIKDCIETEFVHFLNVDNYVSKQTKTLNVVDGETIYICDELSEVNTFYNKHLLDTHTYNYKLVMSHRNTKTDYDYYKRCINRLYELLATDIKKYYLYFHPILGINDFHKNEENVIKELDDFSQFMDQKTKNIFGIYFLLVKHDSQIPCIEYKSKSNYKIFLLFCNREFVDGGTPFLGNCEKEENEVLRILQTIFT